MSNTVLSLAMAAYSFWMSSARTWDPNQAYLKGHFSDTFFRNQAVSMLKFKLWVSGETYATDGECWYRAGKCFGYFGIFPSIVRMPFFLILQSTEYSLAPVSMGIAAGIAMWSILHLLSQVLETSRFRALDATDRFLLRVTVFLLTGTAGSLVMLSQSKVFREASIWMVAMLLLAFNWASRWLTTHNRKYLILAVFAATGATNSRPSAFPVIIVLGLWLYWCEHSQDGSLTFTPKSLPLLMVVAPVASAMFVYFRKFRSPTPPLNLYAGYPSEAMQRYVRLNNGKLQGLRFVPTNLAQYFRPDSVKYSATQPWAHVLVPTERAPIVLSPIPDGGMYFEPSSSITNTMPIQTCLTLFAFATMWAKRKLGQFDGTGQFFAILLIAALAPALSLTTWANTGRYVGDFLPIIVMGTILGLVHAASWLKQKDLLRPAMALLIIAAAYLSLVQYSLNVEGWGFAG